jgi:leucyl aminopeptidase
MRRTGHHSEQDHDVTTISLQTGPVTSVEADALVIGIYKSGDGLTLAPGAEPVDAALGGDLAALLTTLGATGAADEVTRLATNGSLGAPLLVALGLGEAGSGDVVGVSGLEDLRKAAGSVVRSLAGLARVALVTPASGPEVVEATALGAALAAYSFNAFKTGDKAGRKTPVAEIILVGGGAPTADATAAGERAQTVADAVKGARDLINTPPSHLFPQAFVDSVTATVHEAGIATLTVEVLDDAALRAGGYGGLIGVGQGSSRPPRLLKVSYAPDGGSATQAPRSLAFVGKGITFDTGGISLKPSTSMETMKSDMSGAAAVVHTAIAVAKLGLPVKVTAWAALAENMPGGNAIRPSDVLTMYGGKTVEVMNTDAEGRLVLADALVRAAEESPDVIVDVATLTGAQVMALGLRTAAVMSNDEEFRTLVESAAERAGEDFWPMPLPPHLRKSLDSEVADMMNIGERMGGMLVAGLFLKEFVGESVEGVPIPWAHLDIAGPAFNDAAPYGYTPKGGTGFAVRTLVQLAQDAADGLL